ncbi:short chain dehydrogenase [Pseudoclavibacter chungangensis]|uniref:Short chain dehydrogenase n=1 Tax=Pseudoclavibacter chungangensis TaxID=587635 RepID=A0A7J5BPN4_9MICO|nr:short chain dehydrogenase [Pseudoclavibacter chungangensis]KAB1655084.1 short chain dehydrogenase [Pseudoclavibacter chungangensis]NYJ66152.1 NAD(P)-dependent dehydrogenase (short-subunit alcohol dehydrogenase family) [Pseudoclavibacter chungangensis]
MRILVVGMSGHVGTSAAAALGERHDIVGVSRSTDPAVDLLDPASITAAFRRLGRFDAVVSAFGAAPFAPAPQLTADDLTAAFEGKVLSQLNLVHLGLDAVTDGGSFTLTTGILAREPVPGGAAAAMANGAVESYVRTAARELPRGIRINAVSPSVLASAPEYFDAFRGFAPVSDERVGLAFVRSVEGIETGRTYPVD